MFHLHKVQSMMNLRQVLEAGACVAFALANPEHKQFVDPDEYDIFDPPPKLVKKRYAWLKQHYPLMPHRRLSVAANHRQ